MLVGTPAFPKKKKKKKKKEIDVVNLRGSMTFTLWTKW
jgi:hypothetical protein